GSVNLRSRSQGISLLLPTLERRDFVFELEHIRMTGLVANAKIGKLGIQSGEFVIHSRGAHCRAVALILRLSTHTLGLGKERFQVELLLVGFVERVDIRLQPHLQSREYL